MIDRRRVVLGGLAGLIAPAIARAQPPAAGPGPASGPAVAPLGNAGATGSRVQSRVSERRDAATQPPSQTAEQPARIEALVLSQSYRSTPQFALANTARDAALIAQTFQRLRFDRVTVHNDGLASETVARIAAYLAGVDANTIALVYLAGHGLEIAGENLLMLEGGTAFLSLQALVQVLQQRAGVTILFLDACRNNPFDRLAAAGGRVSRAVSLGQQGVSLQTVSLAELRGGSFDPPSRLRAFSLQGSGVKIVFSTDPANVAFDGARPDSRNSPFAQALARHIRDQVSLDDIISLTTGDVIRATRRVQSPWSQGSIDRPIFLSGWRRRRQGNLR
ncbi:MAG TPA: caspase family protein [Allosphingosinicella sp.]|nr:caspase family protein [Allosphingosinicella sp.]